jgi:K+/H+ antiporter YhaU regulatory subunit KhtT
MQLEYSITVGSLIQTAVAVAGFMGFFYSIRGDVKVLQHDMKSMQDSLRAMTEAFSQLGRILTQVAVQDTRINMIEKKIDELSHGQGYVKKRDGSHV